MSVPILGVSQRFPWWPAVELSYETSFPYIRARLCGAGNCLCTARPEFTHTGDAPSRCAQTSSRWKRCTSNTARRSSAPLPPRTSNSTPRLSATWPSPQARTRRLRLETRCRTFGRRENCDHQLPTSNSARSMKAQMNKCARRIRGRRRAVRRVRVVAISRARRTRDGFCLQWRVDTADMIGRMHGGARNGRPSGCRCGQTPLKRDIEAQVERGCAVGKPPDGDQIDAGSRRSRQSSPDERRRSPR